jgi:hypothetical protein
MSDEDQNNRHKGSIIIWDVETTQLIDLKQQEIDDMEISVACAIEFHVDDVNLENAKTYTFWNEEVISEFGMGDLARMLSSCKHHVAFNGLRFDMRVMKQHFKDEVEYNKALDRLSDPFYDLSVIAPYSLNALLKANKLQSKSGSGKDAPVLWKQKRFEDLEQYCMDDVRLLAQLVTQESTVRVPNMSIRIPLQISEVLFGAHL